jgi:hypothetical protein
VSHQANSTLLSLDISNNRLGPDGGAALAEVRTRTINACVARPRG